MPGFHGAIHLNLAGAAAGLAMGLAACAGEKASAPASAMTRWRSIDGIPWEKRPPERRGGRILAGIYARGRAGQCVDAVRALASSTLCRKRSKPAKYTCWS